MILKELHYRNNIINLMKRNVKPSMDFSNNWQRILLRTQVHVKHVTSIKFKSDINEYIFFIIKSNKNVYCDTWRKHKHRWNKSICI